MARDCAICASEKHIATGSHHRAGQPRRRAQITQFLQVLANDPLVARAFVVDVLGAGPRTLRRREAVNARFGDAILGKSVDPVLRKAIIGGVNTVSAGMLLDDRAAELPAIADTIVAFVEDALTSGSPSRARRQPRRRTPSRRPRASPAA